MPTSQENSTTRRGFIRRAACGALVAVFGLSTACNSKRSELVVWSCGGIAEGLKEVNEAFEQEFNCRILLTSGAAGYLTKALAHQHKGGIDVFVPRTATENPEYLVEHGKMNPDYKLFCIGEYVVVTAQDNPAGITSIEDLGGTAVKVAFASEAATPEGECILEIVEAAGIKEQFLRNVVIDTDCPRKFLQDIASGKVDAAIIERRLAMLPVIKDKVRIIPIAPEITYKGKLCKEKSPFVIGLMTTAKNPELAREYISFALGTRGQKIMEKHGFVHRLSPQCKLYEELVGVKGL